MKWSQRYNLYAIGAAVMYGLLLFLGALDVQFQLFMNLLTPFIFILCIAWAVGFRLVQQIFDLDRARRKGVQHRDK